MLVAIQLFVSGLYLPPVSKKVPKNDPPQIIISLPLQTAVWSSRASGTLLMLVGVQLFVLGLYLPPVFRSWNKSDLNPPQTIISVPVHTAVCDSRGSGGFVVLVAVQLSVLGL